MWKWGWSNRTTVEMKKNTQKLQEQTGLNNDITTHLLLGFGIRLPLGRLHRLLHLPDPLLEGSYLVGPGSDRLGGCCCYLVGWRE